MESAGEKWTVMRDAVFASLAAMPRPASAYDIAEQVSLQLGKRVVPNSVYRILDLFVARNLAIRVESANAYIANSHPGCKHDCIFLICDKCGEATHVDNDALAKQVRAVAEGAAFTPVRPIMEVRGYCAACS